MLTHAIPRPIKQSQGATHALILGFALLHLLFAARVPLAGHEAHYGLYGYYLDWSYVDHPPLIGWLQALALRVSGADLMLRLIPIALSVLSQYLLVGLVRRLYPQGSPWLGFVSVLLLQGVAVTHVAITMAPDSPLVPLSIMAVWLTHRLLHQDAWRYWVGLGLVLGLAGLAKYTAVLLALSVAVALVIAGQGRAFLRPRLWVSALIAAVLISPVLVWNWQHDWISFAYQFSYQVKKEGATSGWSLARALEMQGGQVLAYSPLLYLGGVLASIWAVRRRDQESALLLVFALPPLLLVSWAAGFGRSAPHWTYFGWVLMTPVAARWLLEHWTKRPVRVLAYLSAVYSGLLLLFAAAVMQPALRFPESTRHPLGLVAGWDRATERALRLLQEMAAEDSSGQEPVLLVQNWHHARWLAWYARPAAALDAGRRRSQYSFWFGEVDPGSRGILVVPNRRPGVPEVRLEGFHCTSMDELPAYLGANLLQTFHFFHCEGGR